MEYPVWYIPGVSYGLIMAIISVLHVFVAQFAVGGGIYLVYMERKARRENSAQLYSWLHRHTWFFLLLTMVFGGLSGVAIWFTMGVINPAATSSLIHIFLWLWAAEWVFFLVEIVSLLVYYYTYPLIKEGRISAAAHWRVGCVYAFAGYMSLVLINGIISFMLTPGEALKNSSLAQAFFNPSFLSSLAFRTALCLLLAGMFALFTASRIQDAAVRRKVTRISALWVCAPFLALLAASAWYFMALPPDRQAAVLRRTADIHPFVLAYGWVLPVIFLLGILAFMRAEKMRRPLSVLILCAGLTLVGSFEWMRETARRPWVIPGYMYASAVRPSEGEKAAHAGVGAVSGWVGMIDRADSVAIEKAASDASGNGIPAPTLTAAKGAFIFAQQCGPCHGVGGPRIDILPRLKRFSPAGIEAQINGQGVYLDYMPPFFGSREDREALAVYLNALMLANVGGR